MGPFSQLLFLSSPIPIVFLIPFGFLRVPPIFVSIRFLIVPWFLFPWLLIIILAFILPWFLLRPGAGRAESCPGSRRQTEARKRSHRS